MENKFVTQSFRIKSFPDEDWSCVIPPVYEILVSPGGFSHKSVVWSRKNVKSTLARLSGRPYFPITWSTKSQPQIKSSKIWTGASNIPFSVLRIWRMWHSDDRLFEKSKMLKMKIFASHVDLKKMSQWPQCAHDGIHIEKLCSKVVSDPRMRWQMPAKILFLYFRPISTILRRSAWLSDRKIPNYHN